MGSTHRSHPGWNAQQSRWCGALVAIVGSGGLATRVTPWVMRSSGFNSSLSRKQVIGLGNRLGSFSVTVTWVSGIVQSRTGANFGDTMVTTESFE